MPVDATPIPGVGELSDRLKLVKPDLGGVTLSPTEMFFVSRMIGIELRVSDLLAGGGLPKDEAIALVARLIRAGVVQNSGPPPRSGSSVAIQRSASVVSTTPPPRTRSVAVPTTPTPRSRSVAIPTTPPPRSPPVAIPTSAVPADPDVELSPDLQAELLMLEVRIRSKDPREVLGLSQSASLEDAKQVYFAYAHKLHPDQFFRKKLGPFKVKIELIFARFSAAFSELARSPTEETRVVANPMPGGIVPPPAPRGAEMPPLPPKTTPPLPVAPEAELPPASQELPDMLPDMAESPPTEAAAVPPEAPPAEPAPPDVEITGRPRERYAKAIAIQHWAIAVQAIEALTIEEPNALDLPKLKADLTRRESEAAAAAAFFKGNDFASKGDWDQAYKCYEQACSLNPRSAVYIERTGRALMYAGDLKEAKRLIERAIELKPEEVNAHVTLANIFLKAGMDLNAKREFETVLRLDPKNEVAKSSLRKGWWKT